MKKYKTEQENINTKVNEHIEKIIKDNDYQNNKLLYHPPTNKESFMFSSNNNLFSPINSDEINKIMENRINKIIFPKIIPLIIIIIVLLSFNIIFIILISRRKNININYNKKLTS